MCDDELEDKNNVKWQARERKGEKAENLQDRLKTTWKQDWRDERRRIRRITAMAGFRSQLLAG